MDFRFPSSQRARGAAFRAIAMPLAVLSVAIAAFLALPAGAASGATVSTAISRLQNSGSITAEQASAARKAYASARSVRRRAKGASRTAIRYQIGIAEKLARANRLTGDRVRPVFETLGNNAAWFRENGPRPAGTDRRFGDSRIIFQYFAGQGWQFHPLSNFAKLNAVWTVKSAPARRSLGKYAHELIAWGVMRGEGLTWEYYFPFSGSSAPFISSISQGTAIQALARSGNALNDSEITAAARKAMLSFDMPAPTGLKIQRDVGNHYIGYSGNRRLQILNMFLQSLDGLHDYSIITDDAKAWDLYREGLKGARRDTTDSDTGAWSLYSLRGSESSLHYHQLVTGFLAKLCDETKEDIFCGTRSNFADYTKQAPRMTAIKARVRRGKLVVNFRLSKISTVSVTAARSGKAAASAKATVGYGKRRFSIRKPKKKGSYTVYLTAVDLAGNRGTAKVKVRVR
ncbi:MAG: hypothetical protein HZB14_08085 [Actinobacteria bacterium]|nr:hypothetical protein [Actinomycetota bacterium]